MASVGEYDMGKIQGVDGEEYADLGDAFQKLKEKAAPSQVVKTPEAPPSVKPCRNCGTEMVVFATKLYSQGRMKITTWMCSKCNRSEQDRDLVVLR